MRDTRFTVADLAASGVLEHGRNRERVAEAAGLPLSRALTADSGPVSTGPTPAPARPALGPEGLAIGHRPDHAAGAGATPAGVPDDLWPLLLAVLGEPRRIPRLDGEDAVQAKTVFRLDVGVRTRTLPIIAVMVRNDIVQRRAPKHLLERDPGLIRWDQRERQYAGREAARAAAMGLRKGFPDCLLLNAALSCPTERFGLLEVKSRTGSLEPEQRRWRDLCAAAGWHWALAREPEHATNTDKALRVWGWL